MRRCLFLIIAFCGLAVYTASAQTVFGAHSSLRIVSVNGSLGMMLEPSVAPESDILTLKGGDSFTLTVDKVTSDYAVSGKLVVALVRNSKVVDVLSSKNIENATTATLGFQFFSCRIGDDVVVESGDYIKLLFTLNDIVYTAVNAQTAGWATDAIPATNYALPLCHITYPANVPGVTITQGKTNVWPDKAIRGRNFYLYIEPDDPESTVIVRANGMPWIPSDGLYAITGISRDYDVEIKVYPKGIIYPYKEIECTSSERVADLLTEIEADCLRGLKVKGEVKAVDFPYFRDRMMSLQILDLTEAKVEKDIIPENAFNENKTIQEVKLPESIIALANNAFRFMSKISFIVLPEKLCQFGYNEFFGSTIKTVRVKWDPIKNYDGIGVLMGFPIPPCAFRSTVCAGEGTLIVPKGCVDIFRRTENWGAFKTIREPLPIDFKLELPFDRYLTTGINETGKDETGGFVIETSRGECRIIQEMPDIRRIEVIDAGGRLCDTRMTDGLYTAIPLSSGFYIIRVGGESKKVLVP